MLLLLLFNSSPLIFIYMQYFYDFKANVEYNPFASVNSFFINPYMIEGFKTLNLEQNNDITIMFQKGLPVLVIPLNVLNINKGIIKIADCGSRGTITYNNSNVTIVLYFQFTLQANIIKIDSVITKKIL